MFSGEGAWAELDCWCECGDGGGGVVVGAACQPAE